MAVTFYLLPYQSYPVVLPSLVTMVERAKKMQGWTRVSAFRAGPETNVNSVMTSLKHFANI